MEPNPSEIFLQVAIEKFVHKKWLGSPHEAFKNLANSSKGDAGEEFIRRYGTALGFSVAEKSSNQNIEDTLTIINQVFGEK